MTKSMKPKTQLPKCIHCGSDDVEKENDRWQDSDFRWHPARYSCNICTGGFTEEMVPELKKDFDEWKMS